MEQLTGNFARPQSIRRQHAIKGILYMIDSAGGHALTTEAQDKIIENQLRQDTYEYESKTGGRPQKYNVQKVRALMAKLAQESKLKTTVRGEDKVTLLFRLQSQALDPIILAKCGYRRTDVSTVVQQQSFKPSEGSTARPAGRADRGASRNPSSIPDALQKMRPYHDERAFLLVLQDIDASKFQRNEPYYKYNTRQARMEALQKICSQSKLTMYGVMESTRLLDNSTLHDIVYRIWSDQKPHQWVKFDSFWREGSDSLEPDQLQRLKLSCAQLDLVESMSVLDRIVDDTSTPNGLGTTSVSASSSSQGDAVNVTFSTPPQRSRDSKTIRLAFDQSNSRSLKRKASSDASPEATFQSPVVFVSQNESPGSVGRAVRDACVGRRRLSVGSQSISPSAASREMESIFNAQKFELLGMIGSLKFTQCSCPLTPQPSHELILLYKRCWGEDWKRGGDALLMGGKRSVLDDTTALISAFYFEHIWTGASPPGTYNADDARNDELASTTPSSNQNTLLSQLSQTHARAITAEFFCALSPYFASLTQLSRMMYSNRPKEDPDPTPFRKAMSGIISKALTLRSKLDASEMDALFFWPTRGDIYDSECMQTSVTLEMSTSLTYLVAFTTFPGLTYVDPVVGVVYKACVVLRVEAAR